VGGIELVEVVDFGLGVFPPGAQDAEGRGVHAVRHDDTGGRPPRKTSLGTLPDPTQLAQCSTVGLRWRRIPPES